MSSFLDDFGESSTIKVGDKAPDFVLCTEQGEKWQLSDHLGNVTALLFYPKSETLVCRRQLCSVRDNWVDYVASKASVVGISAGKMDDNLYFSQRYKLPLPLLLDVDRKVTSLYSEHWLMPVQFTRAIVIVDAKGIIRHRKVMLRAFRPTDRSVLASIYAARTDYLYDNYRMIKESYQKNNPLDRK